MEEGPSGLQRRLVLGVLAALLVAGVGVVEAWPLTAWRLFSETRADEQAGWSVVAVDAGGDRTRVPLVRLGLGYRFAGRAFEDAAASEWCGDLLAAVHDVEPGAVAVEVRRTRRRLAEVDDGWASVEVASELVLRCGADPR